METFILIIGVIANLIQIITFLIFFIKWVLTL